MAALPAVLTMLESPAALPLLEAELMAEAQPTLDASALTTLDTATLAVLLQCKRSLAAQGKALQITGKPRPPSRTRRSPSANSVVRRAAASTSTPDWSR